MGPVPLRQVISGALLLIALLMPVCGQAASVRPLEMVTEKILRMEVERLAADHIMSTELLRRALEKLNKGLNITSGESITGSLKLLAEVREINQTTARSAADLSGYVSSYRAQLKSAKHEKFLPFARLNEDIEKPYHEALDKYLHTSTQFVQYCGDNLEAISTGQKVESNHYDELYAAYLRDMEAYNQQSMKRSQILGDWTALYPALLEYLPR